MILRIIRSGTETYLARGAPATHSGGITLNKSIDLLRFNQVSLHLKCPMLSDVAFLNSGSAIMEGVEELLGAV